VAFFLAFALAFIFLFDTNEGPSAMQAAIDGAMEDMIERGAIESRYDVELQGGTNTVGDWTAPSPVSTGSFIVLDDRTSLAEGEASLDSIIRSLKTSGWSSEDDLDLVAESAVAIARCQGGLQLAQSSSLTIDFDCEELDQFRLEHDVEGILWVTTMRDQGASTVIEGTTPERGEVIRAVFLSNEITEVPIDGLPYVEVQGLWPDGTRETVQIPLQTSSVDEDSDLRVESDSSLKEVLENALNGVRAEVQSEVQDAMQEIGSELDQSRTTLQKACDQLQKIPDGVQFRSGPMTIRIAA
jgi:hypothetical protein